MTQPGSGFTPLAASTGQSLRLAMQQLQLTGRVLPCGARLSVEHVFQSGETQPLEVIYSFPLPRDAALRQFRIAGDGWEAVSDLLPADEARKTYEAGIRQGSLSAMAQQHGDGVVNLAVGNLRPGEVVRVHLEILAGVELHDTGCRFRFPFTLGPAYHPQARPIVRPDGAGEMLLPREMFGDVILPPVHRDAAALHRVGFDLAVECGAANGRIASPSHPVRTGAAAEGGIRISLDATGDVPDRDLILDIDHSAPQIRVFAGRTGDGRRQFAAIVPSTAFGANPNTARRVVILLDRSGSMAGAPIDQARRAIEACLGALSPQDTFGLVAFDDRVETFGRSLCSVTQENRDGARRFLASIDARGGTALALGIEEAARLASAGGDVFILTDGQVSDTESILAKARATGLRLHCLGIGSASQDRFLTLLARETAGVSRFVTAEERVDLSAVELFASIGRPVASGVKVSPDLPVVGLTPVVFSGTPLLLYGETAEDAIELRWDNGGSLRIPLGADRDELAGAVRLLRGSRLITDCECRYPGRRASTAIDERQQTRVAELLRDLGRTYGLANREMSLVAVVKRASDRPGELPETRVVPVGMPRGTQFDAYFAPAGAAAICACAPPPVMPCAMPMQASKPAGFFARLRRQSETPEDKLMTLAARIEPDGGMPGDDMEARIRATIAALRKFLREGHTASSGVFRSHVARLIEFLENAPLSHKHRREFEQLVQPAKR